MGRIDKTRIATTFTDETVISESPKSFKQPGNSVFFLSVLLEGVGSYRIRSSINIDEQIEGRAIVSYGRKKVLADYKL